MKSESQGGLGAGGSLWAVRAGSRLPHGPLPLSATRGHSCTSLLVPFCSPLFSVKLQAPPRPCPHSLTQSFPRSCGRLCRGGGDTSPSRLDRSGQTGPSTLCSAFVISLPLEVPVLLSGLLTVELEAPSPPCPVSAHWPPLPLDTQMLLTESEHRSCFLELLRSLPASRPPASSSAGEGRLVLSPAGGRRPGVGAAGGPRADWRPRSSLAGPV